MLKAIIFLEQRTQIFEQSARVGNVFKALDALPGGVQASITRDQIAHERIEPFASSESRGSDNRLVGEQEIENEAAGGSGEETVVERFEIRRVGLERARERLPGEQSAANVGEAVAPARIEPGLESGLIQIGRRHRYAKPEMRLFVCSAPVAEIRNVDKARTGEVGNAERDFLIVVALNGTRDVVVPITGLGRSEADAQRAAVVGEAPHEIGCGPRRAKLHIEQLVFVGRCGSRQVASLQVEAQLAGKRGACTLRARRKRNGGRVKGY